MGKLKAQVQIVLNNNYCSFEAGGELKGHILLNIDEHQDVINARALTL